MSRDAEARGEGLARPALGRVAAIAVYALIAGGLVFAVEAFDRLRVLRGNLDGPAEAGRLALLLGATVLAVALVAFAAGALLAAADLVRRWTLERMAGLAPKWRQLAALAASAAAVAVVLRLISAAAPTVAEGPVYRLIYRVDNRLVPLGPVADHPKVVFALGLAVVTMALMALFAWLFAARGRRARLASSGAALALLGFVVLAYAADSRVEFTRYERMFHIPLEGIYACAALAACVAAARALGDPVRVALARPAFAAAGLAAALGIGSVVYGAVAMDASQNVKALFWNRSVVARRVFQAARHLTDRDGDGFASTFGGGDLDDSDPAVHPLAAERPGNGVDDNCIGGDMAAAGLPAGSLFVPVRDASSPPPVPPPAVEGPRDVLLVSIDCLRADRLGAYGYRKPTSPNIDRFAAGSLLFENAYAQGTNTGHSFTSMFRSSYADDIFDDRIPTFARLLGAAGYRRDLLNAVRTDVWLNANRWEKYRELTADFELLHGDGERLWNAEQLTDRAIALLDSHDPARSHLTWIHYFDCHRPRRRHPQHDFGRGQSGLFDANVAYTDEHVGRLLDHLGRTGRLDRTIVFIVADHGEAFMEHGAQDHSNKPYNNNTLVPLIVRLPGATPGRFAEPCGLIDVGPTALAFAGLPTPEFYRGIDLAAAARGGRLPSRQIVSETPRNLIESSFYSWALVDWPHKIIWDVRSNAIEVFDLEADPGEQRNLADRDPALAARMRGALGAWLDRETARTGAVGPGDSDLSDDDGD